MSPTLSERPRLSGSDTPTRMAIFALLASTMLGACVHRSKSRETPCQDVNASICDDQKTAQSESRSDSNVAK